MSYLGNKQVMADNIKYYMKLHDKSRAEICKDLGFKYSTFSEWLNAKKYPRIDKIEILANYFNVNKSALVEKRSPAANTADQNSQQQGYYNDPEVAAMAEKLHTDPKMRILFDASKNLNKQDIDFVVNMINELKKKEGIND
ncbi:MAG: helix-turn-helix domain-containing protein [Megasphaera sp.]|jgi:transcriptional regulator with XRE-family HTH domain|nr:helix-turn-helix domain-containing protein [Megasphaera sp.]